MTIHSSTIKKFFRELFTGHNPIRSTTGEIDNLRDTIWQRLEKIDNVTLDKETRFMGEKEKKRHILRFIIRNPTRSRFYYGNDSSFTLFLDDKSRLIIEYYYSVSAEVSDIDEIVSFIAACKERINGQNLQKAKRRKVRDFKSQAILAQIKKLAKEEKFDFYTDSDTVKVKLFVKFAEKENIELHIPFNKFQEILPNLRSCILSLRELRNMGIKFKIKQISSYSRSSWITWDSLD